jgi:hypothetical protein
MDNHNVPDFIDISPEATQEAIRVIADQQKGALTPPKGCAAYISRRKIDGPNGPMENKIDEWVEAITIEKAFRKLSSKQSLDITLVARVRATSENNANRTFYTHKYITPADLAAGTMKPWVSSWLVNLLKVCNMLPPDGVVTARLLNVLFPPEGQPGAQSPLVGKSMLANIRQQDNYWNGRLDRRDEATSFFSVQ